MRFGIHLVKQGVISSDQFVNAVERQLNSRPPIGAIAIETRRLSMRQVFQVLAAQATSDTPFGQLAVEMGLLRHADIAELLAMQMDRTQPFSDVLIEMGAMDEGTVVRLWRDFHLAVTDADSIDTESPQQNRSAAKAGHSAPTKLPAVEDDAPPMSEPKEPAKRRTRRRGRKTRKAAKYKSSGTNRRGKTEPAAAR